MAGYEEAYKIVQQMEKDEVEFYALKAKMRETNGWTDEERRAASHAFHEKRKKMYFEAKKLDPMIYINL